MIVKEKEEMLTSLHGSAKINLDQLCDQATAIEKSFTNTLTRTKTRSLAPAGNVCTKPFYMDSEGNFIYSKKNGKNTSSDITSYALGQAALIWKIPAGFLSDLYDNNLGELAETNVRTLIGAKNEIPSMRVMESDGVVEAILSEKYADNYPTSNVLEDIRNYVDLDKYIPNQVYLSKSRFHIRFVDFENPEYINGEKMSAGFTVSNSDIGKSALKVNFFLYKFACKNGIVRVGKGGTLFRQTHLGERISDIAIHNFRHSFENIEWLRAEAMDQIAACQGKKITEAEMQAILDTARKNNCPMGQKERGKIIELANEIYGSTKWGLINGITEVAQDHTLDNRLAYEVWAGRLLAAA